MAPPPNIRALILKALYKPLCLRRIILKLIPQCRKSQVYVTHMVKKELKALVASGMVKQDGHRYYMARSFGQQPSEEMPPRDFWDTEDIMDAMDAMDALVDVEASVGCCQLPGFNRLESSDALDFRICNHCGTLAYAELLNSANGSKCDENSCDDDDDDDDDNIDDDCKSISSTDTLMTTLSASTSASDDNVSQTAAATATDNHELTARPFASFRPNLRRPYESFDKFLNQLGITASTFNRHYTHLAGKSCAQFTSLERNSDIFMAFDRDFGHLLNSEDEVEPMDVDENFTIDQITTDADESMKMSMLNQIEEILASKMAIEDKCAKIDAFRVTGDGLLSGDFAKNTFVRQVEEILALRLDAVSGSHDTSELAKNISTSEVDGNEEGDGECSDATELIFEENDAQFEEFCNEELERKKSTDRCSCSSLFSETSDEDDKSNPGSKAPSRDRH